MSQQGTFNSLIAKILIWKRYMDTNLQNISWVLKSSEGIKLVDDFNMSCLEIWLNKSLVHWVHLQKRNIWNCYIRMEVKRGKKENLYQLQLATEWLKKLSKKANRKQSYHEISVKTVSDIWWIISSGSWPTRWMSRKTRFTRSKWTPPVTDTRRSIKGRSFSLKA